MLAAFTMSSVVLIMDSLIWPTTVTADDYGMQMTKLGEGQKERVKSFMLSQCREGQY